MTLVLALQFKGLEEKKKVIENDYQKFLDLNPDLPHGFQCDCGTIFVLNELNSNIVDTKTGILYCAVCGSAHDLLVTLAFQNQRRMKIVVCPDKNYVH